jgi:hypothetical protein
MDVDTQALLNMGMSDADIAALSSWSPDQMSMAPIDILGTRAPATANPFQAFTAPLSNKGNPTSQLSGNQFAVFENQPVRLVDNRTNQVVFEGSGYDAAKQAIEIAQNMSNTQGRKAAWDIQTLNPETSSYVNVANEKANKSTLGTIGSVLGTALPIAMIPLTMGASAPLAGLGAAGTIGLGAGVGAASAGLKGQNILKGAVMGGLTSAGGQLLGGATGPLSGLGADVGTAVGTGLGATAGGLATGQSLKNALIGGVTAGGMQYLGGKLFGPSGDPLVDEWAKSQGIYDLASLETPTIGSGVVGTTLPAPSSAGSSTAPSSTVPSDFTATGTRLSSPIIFGASNVIPSARYSGDGPTPSDYTLTAKETPVDQTPPFAVTAGATTPPSDYTLTAKETPVDQTPPFAVTTGATTPPSDYTLTAKKTDDLGQVSPLAVNTGPYVAPPSDIKVTAKKSTPTDNDNPLFTPPFHFDPLPPAVDKAAETDTEADDKNKLGVKEALALLGLLGGIGGGGGGGGGGTAGSQALNPIFSAKLPKPGEGGAFKVGGFDIAPPAARPTTDWYRYATGPAMDIRAGTDLSKATSPYAAFGPGTLGEETFKQVTGMSHGGSMGYARGSSRDSFAVEGPGTGRSDDIPAVLSDGEYVIDAETVALLGDGSSKAGAKKLDEMRVKVRKHKGRNLAKGKFSVNAKRPEKYLSGGRA